MARELIVALDNIRSHHNVGSVFRSADAFGVKTVILSGISPNPPHRDIHKTALGATESVNWRSDEDLNQVITELKSNGFRIIAIEQHDRSIKMPGPEDIKHEKLCIVLGNEVKGVSDDIIEHCDEVWEIPQFGTKKSLNVSVCAGICMYNLMK
jgi:tRNA G18 (ribose-2'-O)-methylase SpoU